DSMAWRDEGLVLSSTQLGERRFLVCVFTKDHGKRLGVTHKRFDSALRVDVQWTGREHHQLGRFTPHPLSDQVTVWPTASTVGLAMLSMTELLADTLPEADPEPALFALTDRTLSATHRLTQQTMPTKHPAMLHSASLHWLSAYVLWEVALLSHLGYRLALDQCAVTGVEDGLCFVSPKTGRAVTEEVGAPYRRLMLPLPQFMTQASEQDATSQDIRDGLTLTGHFLERHAIHHMQKGRDGNGGNRRSNATGGNVPATTHRQKQAMHMHDPAAARMTDLRTTQSSRLPIARALLFGSLPTSPSLG
ncbi:MAG: DNA repair protein RecO, partial [Alphaproteobacteria bacterium]|nr:DNA repair protein RecO [Alphaproteobacteria bacterium]